MKTNRIRHWLIICAIPAALSLSGPAQVLLDDDWEDGDRTDTNLPEESAWFASNVSGVPTLSASIGALLGNVRMFETNTGSRLWITHFTPPGSPVELAPGDVLKLSLAFVASNVTVSPTTSRGLRIGLFNFSEPGAARVSGDGFSTGSGAGAPGANVTGYMLNMNFAQVFTINAPLQIMKRTDLATNNLMGTSAAYTALSSGGGTAGSPGFSNGVPYTFEFILRRSPEPPLYPLMITARFSDAQGWSIEHTAIDANQPYVGFDGFAIRPNSVTDSADAFTFTRLKVELQRFSPRILSLQFLTAFDTILTFEALPGKSYDLEARSGFSETTPWTLVGSVVATRTNESVIDYDGALQPQRFYRVVQGP